MQRQKHASVPRRRRVSPHSARALNAEMFYEAARPYNNALMGSDHRGQLQYIENKVLVEQRNNPTAEDETDASKDDTFT
ncbi:hypothetical protein ElyMa_006413200 [Elysia marginata]|uniref:Uncharacterized protein n=1 Tax=Elysia marginata TaxID=1093978 RepID=A0AAV4HTU5_9GAST|nr:hypothetical protein ElyMa_006413200 [Elysia marginata]